MRLAIVASRGRLIRQLLTESLIIAVLGGAWGLFVAQAGVDLFSQIGLPGDPAFRRNVLGRRGWLEHVRVAFVDYERLLFLGPDNQS